jgi:uracil-DNA glycosylase
MIFLEKEYMTKNIFPPKENVFEIFNKLDYQNIKVVILGQDPYHKKGQCHGPAFSVLPGVKIPPSLRNIYKELEAEYMKPIEKDGYLNSWVEQGVFLLNSVLTVEEGKANSHQNKGWEKFTDHVIKLISQRNIPVVFLLWGKSAEKKRNIIDENKHLVLTSPHPSPLSASRGFFGNMHFIKANNFLEKNNLKKIDWFL